ncbi:MAG: undecaprenyl-diphosphate phosphatase [Zetaproteobacteria bacterium]|nr:undecaprenyl-diphosphate phosphatase [Zetaproteobacteria bacterium]
MVVDAAMPLQWVILLGVIQGIAEFLPISSSGHLVIASWLMSGQPLPLAFNTALHFGTLLAVVSYFFTDWWGLLWGMRSAQPQQVRQRSRTLFLALVVGSFPAAVLGLGLKDFIEQHLHHPWVVAFPLAGVGVLMWWVDRKAPACKTMADMTLASGWWIGVAQAMALIPGVSRSGATLTCARGCGFDRESAARFSFLLGTPAMLGASLLQYREMMLYFTDPTFVWGVLVSALTGLAAIRFFLQYIQRINFVWFALYRVGMALLILLEYDWG